MSTTEATREAPLHELLATFTDWVRQVVAREDVPLGIRSAAANLHDDGKRHLAAPSARTAEQAPIAYVPRAKADGHRWIKDEICRDEVDGCHFEVNDPEIWECMPLYATPPSPKVEALTDEQIDLVRRGANRCVFADHPEEAKAIRALLELSQGKPA